MKRLAVLTGGGDCPGLNAVIRAIVKSSVRLGMEVFGIRDGFHGAVEGDFIPLGINDVSGILPRGGTILGTTNRDNPFSYRSRSSADEVPADRSGDVLRNLEENKIDALLVIGGDGSLSIALEFSQLGFPVVGIPKTIDNDVMATDLTFGFQSAVNFAQDALDRLHTTAESHHRIMILEVMGRYAGWIALYAGTAGGADVILIPEIPYNMDSIVKAVQDRIHAGKRFSIVVAAEGAKPIGGEMTVDRILEGRPEPIRLGGIGARLSDDLEKLTGLETRSTVLGHLQRGGSPLANDRILATRYGVSAVRAAIDQRFEMMVALQGNQVTLVPLKEAVNRLKLVPADDEVLLAARSVGICMGD
ncbi:6-phosphofructokinase [Parasporobacterium paucivorans]|uniref:ATP-dependent 6-phosphofructokinase n=1 Tax=Parasporobacterium paucivorans DSM 15970 TaxID=1122934 RepID=A0A1M6JJD7_9FIRM|nr:ATP-dependent 6-phosphofructokinase [Parasporobacterium paucivorans]SHJ46796.1 6-phosphofructokinase 1 [Parasporobacterium paucivorans DSM 15970]